MRRELPPLNALKAFELAARHLSFSKAAEELCVTQGAVSKQVHALEEYLEQPLFERYATGIALSEAGLRYLPTISSALDSIQYATAQLQQSINKANTISLNVTPSFSTLWLIPKLEHLHQQYPELNLDITTGDNSFNFVDTNADLVVRCLPISANYEHAELLIEENLLLVASPILMERQSIQNVTDILKHTLLPHITRPQLWSQFFSHIDSSQKPLPTPKFGMGFEHFYMSLEAINNQMGIGLIPDFMVQPSINKGELVNPLELRLRSGFGFYLMTPGYKQHLNHVQRIRDWLKQQIQRP